MKRIANDFYPTARDVTVLLREKIHISGSVFEPCAGDSHIANEFSNCITNDIDSSRLFLDFSLDATKAESWQTFGKYDWIVTNPPYKEAFPILQHAWDNCNVGVAFLLRLSFLEPTKERGDWLAANADHMSNLIPVNPRVRFRSDTKTTDSVTSAWFIWLKKFSWKYADIDCPFQFIRNWR